MIRKVVGINLNMLDEALEVIDEVVYDISSRLDSVLPCDVDCELYAIEDIIAKSESEVLEFDDETVVVLGVPVVKNRIPLTCLRLVQRMSGSGTMTVAVVTYGNASYGRSLNELAGFVEAQGFNIVSAAAFIAKKAAGNVAKHSLVGKRPDVRDYEMIKLFGTATSNKITRLSGSEVDLLKVKPAPINIYSGRKSAVQMAVDTVRRKEPEWFL